MHSCAQCCPRGFRAPGHEAHEVELGAKAVHVPRQALLAVATRHLHHRGGIVRPDGSKWWRCTIVSVRV